MLPDRGAAAVASAAEMHVLDVSEASLRVRPCVRASLTAAASARPGSAPTASAARRSPSLRCRCAPHVGAARRAQPLTRLRPQPVASVAPERAGAACLTLEQADAALPWLCDPRQVLVGTRDVVFKVDARQGHSVVRMVAWARTCACVCVFVCVRRRAHVPAHACCSPRARCACFTRQMLLPVAPQLASTRARPPSLCAPWCVRRVRARPRALPARRACTALTTARRSAARRSCAGSPPAPTPGTRSPLACLPATHRAAPRRASPATCPSQTYGRERCCTSGARMALRCSAWRLWGRTRCSA